ncbi:hypothetical protein N7G274_006613 [Stereocaulon virgatum]|uniref:Uncharacterized protein n=1 Tax=Stereocaulon virgatum TaxID=373712 RepID=A0ABR4A3Z7_9LECA
MHWMKGVHVFATSRKEKAIEEALSVCATYQTDFGNDDVDADIQLHIRRQIQDDPKLAAWPPTIQQEIEQILGSRANGMFRWAVCQLDAIHKCVNLDILRKLLRNLPKTLKDTYQRILCSIDEECVDIALKTLQWLTFYARPMSLDEIAEIVAIDLTKDPKFDDARRLRRPEDVVSSAQALLSSYRSRSRPII